MMKKITFYILLSLSVTSCEEFLEVGPNTSELDAELVFKNDNTAIATLDAIYHNLQINGFASGNIGSITFLGNILADDAIEYGATSDRNDLYTNNLRADNSANYNLWSSAYKRLYEINALLEGITDNVHLSDDTKNRIESEAKFLRAFVYYYLVHLYHEVPLLLTTDYAINSSMTRTPIEKIYQQINLDLKDASALLPADYKNSDDEHIRPTTHAVHTLLARMALWEKNYDEAITYSSSVIDAETYQLIDLNNVFKANSSETIWSLVPGDPNNGANESLVYILENNPGTPYNSATSAITSDLLNVWSSDDLRVQKWVNVYVEGADNYYYPFKYKIKNGGASEEYSIVLRLAELYLIRAEAQAKLGNIGNALADLNIIRSRARLDNWIIDDITNIEQAVLDERRRELFSEWGHRWLDLKRFGKLDEVLGHKKPKWQSHTKLLPIPEQDLLRNPFLTQNPGY